MPESDYEQKLYADRLAKLDRIADLGASLGLSRAEALYPNSFPFTHTLPELIALGAPLSAEALEAHPIQAAVAGRLMSHRAQGKAGFAHLQGGGWAPGPDGQVRPGDSAERLQIYVRKDDVGSTPAESETLFALYKLLDLGDHIGVRGTLMRTRTGELTLKVHAIGTAGPESASKDSPKIALGPTGLSLSPAKAEALRAANTGQPALVFLAKAMLALPDKYHGLEDVELRYRQRYVDLIMNSGTLAKAEVPAPAASNPPTAVILSEAQSAESKDPRISPAAPQPPGAPFTAQSHRDVSGKATMPVPPTDPGAPLIALSSGAMRGKAAISAEQTATHPVPGTSPVTDTAAPNAEHNDAPRNVREVFVKRAAILRAIRRFFDARGYLEVETPMMHTVAGGATARPFQTHHNALDIPLSLRIAPELFLKRLVVGGLDRVYEINRNFRNEGVSTQHNPEFTMLEFYQAYSNYYDLMDLTQELITQVAVEVNGTTVTQFNDQNIDLSRWRKLSMCEAIIAFWPIEFGPSPTVDMLKDRTGFTMLVGSALLHCTQNSDMKAWLDKYPNLEWLRFFRSSDMSSVFGSLILSPLKGLLSILVELSKGSAHGKCVAELFETVGENPLKSHLIQPTIIYDFPLAVSPLSKPKPDEPDWVERFEFYIGGFEVGNAFSELNDPADQRRRFEAQLEQKARGDEEAMAAMDEDYVRALGYGLPPTAGEGIGIDRLTMLLTGSRSIRDVILFPLLRPETNPAEGKVTAEPTR